MNLTFLPTGYDSFWLLWPRGAADLGYSPTEVGAEQPARAAQPGRYGTALLAYLSLLGVSGATAFDMLVGTGGTVEFLMAQNPRDTVTSATQVPLRVRLGEQAALTPAEVLAGRDLIVGIKSTLGLSVTDLAAIARVSRQTIYDWIGGGQVSEANGARLRALHQVCLDWQTHVDRPVGRLLHAQTADGRSLLDLLSAESLDRQAIHLHLMALAAKAREQLSERQTRRARLAPLGEKDRYENALTHVLTATDS